VFAAHVLALLACGLLPSVVADAQIATEEQQQRQQPSLPPLDTRWAVGAPAALWPPPPETQTSSFGSSRNCCHCWLTLLVSPVPHSLCLQKERRIAPAALCCCRRVWTAHPRFARFPCPPLSACRWVFFNTMTGRRQAEDPGGAPWVDPGTGQRYWLDAQGQWQAADGTPVSGGAAVIKWGCAGVPAGCSGGRGASASAPRELAGRCRVGCCNALRQFTRVPACLSTCLCLPAGPFAWAICPVICSLPALPLQDWRYLWVELWSQEAQRPYYFHQASKQTSWERPPDLGAGACQWRLLLPLPEVVCCLPACLPAAARGAARLLLEGWGGMGRGQWSSAPLECGE
jgi:hypothetical protein